MHLRALIRKLIIRIPKSKNKTYKKLLKKGGVKSPVRIKKLTNAYLPHIILKIWKSVITRRKSHAAVWT